MDFEAFCKDALTRIGRLDPAKASPGPGFARSGYAALLDLQSVMTNLMQGGGHGGGARDFFLGVLRSFSMTPVERKKMEAASRYFNVSQKRVSLPRGEDWEPKFLATRDKLEAMFVDACKIIGRGEACREDQFCTARCFRLVNTGGFDAKTMQSVQGVVDNAARILDEGGFGALCYGDVLVTNTVARNSRILAFYTPNNDSMFVRANLKGVEGAALATILHEVAHRLFDGKKFITASDRTPTLSLYRKFSLEQRELDREPIEVEGGSSPSVGDLFTYRNEPFRVEQILANGMVRLRGDAPEIARATITMPLHQWLTIHGGRVAPRRKVFPTEYSKKDSSEFFAEMFSYELLDQLTPAQSNAFMPVMEGFAGKLERDGKR